ncbi:MAG: iolE 2 [Verrucomicrobiales bacterium]|nr:iolE 2 [Verrucomicrobiales bacterium]
MRFNKRVHLTNMKRFLASLAVICGLLSIAPIRTVAADDYELKIGVQTWTLRNLNFDQVVDFCVKHKIKYLELIANHMDPKAPMEETRRKKEILDKNGLVAYSFGVAGTSLDKEDNRKMFEFAKFMGIKLIVIEPGDFKIFDNIEELVKEYDIKVAVHNHGITSTYGNPNTLKNLIKYRDKRIGSCLDVGWTASARFDPAKIYREFNGRVYDIHLKDKKVTSTPTGDRAKDVFIGEGDANLKELFKVLKETHYDGILAIETDNDLKDPTEHIEKALAFVEANKP